METIHIAACFDHGFVMPTGVMMYSTCVNNADIEIDFHLVVDESVTDVDQKDLRDTIAEFPGKRVRFYDISCTQSIAFPQKLLPQSTYYRLFLSQILPLHVDKVLYIDGDCIVRHSLLPLWNIDLDGYAIGAAFAKAERSKEIFERLHYPFEYGYFNAGVLLINLKYWRQHGVMNALLSYIEKYPQRIKWEDQDVLNAVLYDKRKHIHIKYNLQTGCLRKDPLWDSWNYREEVIAAIKDPVIVHYTFRSKPWDAYARHPHPFRSTFREYQNKTKWKGCRNEKRNLRTIIRNFIGDGLRKAKILKADSSPFMEIHSVD